jgi:GntR family transcriptional regulator, arabinose operon transcriptional repressor
MQIDFNSAEHKYVQLQGLLQRYLQEARFEAGQQLPTEDELIKRFQVSRVTVRKALQALAEAGVIYKIQGSGTFFSGKLPSERQASYLIGVITPLEFTYIYPQIIQGIGAVAQEKHYNLVLGGSKANPDREFTSLRLLSSKTIDGLIFEPSSGFQYAPDNEIVKMLDALPIPVVFMDWAIDDPQRSYVALDDRQGGLLATNHLIAAGHRRIACIQPSNHLCGLHRA